MAAVLDGSKTSTTATLIEYEIEQEDLPVAGLQEVVIDSAGKPVVVIEMTEIRQARLAEVDLQHAIDEGEGFTTVAQWRAGHEAFWHSQEMRDAMDDPTSRSMTTRCWCSSGSKSLRACPSDPTHYGTHFECSVDTAQMRYLSCMPLSPGLGG